MKKYTTENLESKLKLTKWGSFAIFIFGIIKFIFLDVNHGGNFEFIGTLLDGLLMPIIFFFMFLSVHFRLKKLKGSYINFIDNGVEFKSKSIVCKINSIDELESIKVNLKTVDIRTKKGDSYTFHFDDYFDFSTKKSIKEEFKNLENLKAVA